MPELDDIRSLLQIPGASLASGDLIPVFRLSTNRVESTPVSGLGSAITLTSGAVATALGYTAANAATTRTIDKSPVNFILVGDSIFQGVTNGGATAGNYLQNRLPLKSWFTSRTSTVIDTAVMGRTQDDCYGSAGSTYISEVRTPYKPSTTGVRGVILYNAGTNGTASVASVETYAAAAIADGFEFWACTLLPRIAAVVTQFGTYNSALKASHVPTRVIDLGSLFLDGTDTSIFGDGLHPTNKGYDMLADHINFWCWSDQVNPLLNFGGMAKQQSDSVAITGGTFAGSSVISTTTFSRTSTGASNAELTSQALGATGSAFWLFGHYPNAVGLIPANGFGWTFFSSGTSFQQGLCGFGPGGTLYASAIGLAKTIAAGGTTGAQTINKPSGSVNFAAAATSLVVTNSLVTANSLVFVSLGTADATAVMGSVIPTSGSFTINLKTAPTAETKVNFLVTN